MAWWVCKGEFKGYINITSTANATVTATTGTSSYSAVCDSSGVGQIKVKKKGAYTITSTGTYRTASATVTDKTPVTAIYTWQKWDSQMYYYPACTGAWEGSSIAFWNSTESRPYIWGHGTSYSFNDATGQYTIGGGQGITLSYSYDTGIAIADGVGVKQYFTYPSTTSASNVCTTMGIVLGTSSASRSSVYGRSRKITLETGRAEQWQSGTSYRKGSTQYANATATTLDAYPSNGRYSTDGYWYIAA